MEPSEQALAALRLRLLNDFEFWGSQCCQLRTKKGTHTNLVLNRVQRRFVKRIIKQWTSTGKVRFVVLKARQQGFSTVISALQYWWLSQHSAQKGLVMAHEADSTTTLFDMYQRIHDNCPEWVKPKTKFSSRTELVFKDLDTGLRVATAGGKSVARGETLTFVHLSEVGFWPVAFAATNLNGLIQAVPEENNTFVFLESTANGLSGKFHEMWASSVKGESGYEPFFGAWFETDEYRDDTVKPGFVRTPVEDKVAAHALREYGITLDNAQLYWRRLKIAQSGIELFHQEYPATPEEAFLNTGRPVFSTEQLYDLIRVAKEPPTRMVVEDGSVREDIRGELAVYYPLDPKETYWIGADVGMGIRRGDPSVAQVLDSKLRQVAMWRGLVQPDHFATILNTLGYYYNTACIAVERNNHGLLTCVRLGRDKAYPNTYTDVTEGALEDKDSILIGLFTSEKTKPFIINKLRAVLRDGTIEINDKTTLDEMLKFVVTESGKMEAEGTAHDDCVMSLAIANHVHEGRWCPVEVTDEYYAEAV